MTRILTVFAALLLGGTARAHCPVSFVITGPGGLYWQADVDGDLYDGMLPGGAPGRPGPTTSWTQTRRLGPSTGSVPVLLRATDGSAHALCPTVMLALSGPPRCSEDYDAPGEVPHPLCVIFFTLVKTPSGAYSCSSACRPAASYPPAQSYAPPAAAPPSVSAVSPSSTTTSAAAFALRVSGAGFVGGAVVQWDGVPLATEIVDGGSLVALAPRSVFASAGTYRVTVAIPGAVSAPFSFTVTP